MSNLETIRLDNGLTIYLYPDTRRHTTFFELVTNYGGMTKDFIYDGCPFHIQDGVAHILEHYIVECNPKGNFLEELGNHQMNTNASTYFDTTRFYFDTVTDLSYGIHTFLEGIYSVTFDKEKLEKLKNPIYQEIRGKSDSKFYHSSLMTFNNLFTELSFRSIGGTLEEVQNTTIEDLEVCYKAFYQPSNQFIVIAGNFSSSEVIQDIKDVFEKVSIEKHDVQVIESNETLDVVRNKDVLVYDTPMDYVDISFKIDISHLSPIEHLNLDFYLNTFYHQFFGIISPLHQELVDHKIILSSINVGDIIMDKFRIISIGAYTSDEEYFIQRIFEVIRDMNSFDLESFELDKKSCKIRMFLRDESVMSIILPFVDNVVQYHYPYLDRASDIDHFTFSEYKKTIQNLDFSHYTIVTIKKKES